MNKVVFCVPKKGPKFGVGTEILPEEIIILVISLDQLTLRWVRCHETSPQPGEDNTKSGSSWWSFQFARLDVWSCYSKDVCQFLQCTFRDPLELVYSNRSYCISYMYFIDIHMTQIYLSHFQSSDCLKPFRTDTPGVDGWKDVPGFEELGVRVAGNCNKKLPKKLCKKPAEIPSWKRIHIPF